MSTTDSILLVLATLRRPESLRKLALWVNLLFILILAYTVAGISWRLWPLASPDGQLIVVPSTPVASAAEKGSGLAAVAAMHLFGEMVAVETAVETVIDAPETRLSLTLRGIVAISAGGRGLALIAEGAAEERLYMVGDSLSGGAILHEVHADRVILKRAGRFETLTLPRDTLAQPATSGNAGGGQANTGSRATALGSASAPSPISSPLRELRDSVVADPQQAFDMVQAQPVMEGGGIKGYRVAPGKERRLFQSTGLRAGDVVTQINGIPVGDPGQMATLFEQFKSADRFELVVERGGRETNLSINLGN